MYAVYGLYRRLCRRHHFLYSPHVNRHKCLTSISLYNCIYKTIIRFFKCNLFKIQAISRSMLRNVIIYLHNKKKWRTYWWWYFITQNAYYILLATQTIFFTSSLFASALDVFVVVYLRDYFTNLFQLIMQNCCSESPRTNRKRKRNLQWFHSDSGARVCLR